MTAESAPKVRDLTQRLRRLPIEVDGGSMYELLLVAWLVTDSTEDHGGFEIGADWFEQVAEATPAPLRAEMKELGGDQQGGTWCALRGLVATAPEPHDIESTLTWLGGLDPAEIRKGLLVYQSSSGGDPKVWDRALGGDLDALDTLLDGQEEMSEHYRRLFSLDEGELRDRITDALRSFREVYRRFEGDFAQATSRAANDTRPMVRGADPERVIEAVTNGADYRIPPGVTRVVLVPSVVLRPWAVIDTYLDVLLVVYPVADEYLAADPDAPPSWVVKVHKALGDDKRLRILRRLADSPAGLEDLAALLGVTKSTVHHHVGLLRAAGLVRVSVDSSGNKTYAIRPTVLPGAHEALDGYLHRTDSAASSSKRSEK